jgi:hypothetical protein
MWNVIQAGIDISSVNDWVEIVFLLIGFVFLNTLRTLSQRCVDREKSCTDKFNHGARGVQNVCDKVQQYRDELRESDRELYESRNTMSDRLSRLEQQLQDHIIHHK